ncbi:MAG: hypothetical protein J6R57_03100 [Bacteroidales bacterium]|nr:hypothetical protein [Bacteroidales bacterium]
MRRYLREYGPHFNKELYEFAVSKMFKENENGREERIKPVEKDKVKELLKKYNITLHNDELYDSAYVYSAAMADYFGKSIQTEEMLAKHIKDRIDDVDKPVGYIMNQWYADMCYAGIPVDWEEFV